MIRFLIYYWDSCREHYGWRIIWKYPVGVLKAVPYLVIFSDRNTVISFVSSLLFLGIGIGLGVARYLKVTIGDDKFYVDAVEVWMPVVRALNQGTPLYLNGAADNKPPLFMLLTAAVGETGAFYLVFTLLVGVANGIAAILLARGLRIRGCLRLGIVAALLFLSALPMIRGTIINVRSFALVPLLFALNTNNGFLRGVGVGGAGLCIQYAVFTIPFVAAERLIRLPRNRLRWVGWYLGGGAAIVAAMFGLLGLIYGVESMLAGIHWGYGIDLGVGATATPHGGNPPEQYIYRLEILDDPVVWGGYIFYAVIRITHVFVPAMFGTGYVAVRVFSSDKSWTEDGADGFGLLSVSIVVVLLPTLLINSQYYYWVLLVPFFATLAAIGLTIWLGVKITPDKRVALS